MRLPAERLGGAQVALGRQVDALALDRLDHERGDIAAGELARQRVLVAERHRIAIGQQRSKAFAELGVSVE